MVAKVKDPIEVIILGDRGVVGKEVSQLVAHSPDFTLIGVFRRTLGGEISDGDIEIFTHLEALAGFIQGRPKAIVVSALPSESAKIVEPFLLSQGAAIISNASYARMHSDVPLWFPGLPIKDLMVSIQTQKKLHNGGFIVCQPNCCVSLIARTLFPVLQQLPESKIERIHFVTLQSLSGAGMQGPLAMQMLGNVMLDIPFESCKLSPEIKKMLPGLESVAITAQCHRVPTIRGHIINFYMQFASACPTLKQFVKALRASESSMDVIFDIDLRDTDTYKVQPKEFLDKKNPCLIQLSSLQNCENSQTLQGILTGDNLHTGAAGGVLSIARDLYAHHLR